MHDPETGGLRPFAQQLRLVSGNRVAAVSQLVKLVVRDADEDERDIVFGVIRKYADDLVAGVFQ